MKFVHVAFLALSLSAISCGNVDAKEPTANKNNTAEKKVEWKSETIDVGEIPQGTPKAFKFEFQNNTDNPVLINEVKAQCGCTATDYTKTPVAPKKSGYVTATFNAASPGAFVKTVTVTSTESSTPKTLTIKGIVK